MSYVKLQVASRPYDPPSMVDFIKGLTITVQVFNNHILTQDLRYNYYYQSFKYPVIGYMDP